MNYQSFIPYGDVLEARLRSVTNEEIIAIVNEVSRAADFVLRQRGSKLMHGDKPTFPTEAETEELLAQLGSKSESTEGADAGSEVPPNSSPGAPTGTGDTQPPASGPADAPGTAGTDSTDAPVKTKKISAASPRGQKPKTS